MIKKILTQKYNIKENYYEYNRRMQITCRIGSIESKHNIFRSFFFIIPFAERKISSFIANRKNRRDTSEKDNTEFEDVAIPLYCASEDWGFEDSENEIDERETLGGGFWDNEEYEDENEENEELERYYRMREDQERDYWQWLYFLGCSMAEEAMLDDPSASDDPFDYI